jgi:hypothetical protein
MCAICEGFMSSLCPSCVYFDEEDHEMEELEGQEEDEEDRDGEYF